MYWYGWIALALPCAALFGRIATKMSERTLQCATLFCCALADLADCLCGGGPHRHPAEL